MNRVPVQKTLRPSVAALRALEHEAGQLTAAAGQRGGQRLLLLGYYIHLNVLRVSYAQGEARKRAHMLWKRLRFFGVS